MTQYMNQKKPQAPLDVAQDIIQKNGNNFHYKVVNFLRERGWFVLVSPYYNDNYTDKPREIDIIAEKPFDIHNLFGDQWLGTVNVRLFIECKYINGVMVLWFDQKTITRQSNE